MSSRRHPRAAQAPALGKDGPAVLSALLQHDACTVLTTDGQGRIRYVNRTPAGLTFDQVLGRPALDCVPQAYRPALQQAIEQAGRTGATARLELQASGSHGALAWYALELLPLPGRADRAELVVIANDITERRRLEQALQDQAALLQAILDSTPDAIHVRDLQGRYTFANRAAAAMLGRNVHEVIGMTDVQLLPAGLAQASQSDDRRLLDADRIERGIRQVLDGQGQQRMLDAIQGPLRDAAGQCIGVFGIARDVTEMLHSEQAQRRALEDGRSLLELALSGSELGTWDADLRSGQVRRDNRLLVMLGYGPHELEPTLDAWWRLLHPDDREAVESTREAHIAGTTRIHQSEHRLRHKDGHWVWVFEAGKVLRDADGQAVRAIGTTRDISGQKRAAAESLALIRRIEQLIGPLRGDPGDNMLAPGGDAASVPPLTDRGRQVLGLLAQGLTAAEIAGRLGITRETANTHRRNLMRRLGLRNKAELIRFALENGLGGPLEGDSL